MCRIHTKLEFPFIHYYLAANPTIFTVGKPLRSVSFFLLSPSLPVQKLFSSFRLVLCRSSPFPMIGFIPVRFTAHTHTHTHPLIPWFPPHNFMCKFSVFDFSFSLRLPPLPSPATLSLVVPSRFNYIFFMAEEANGERWSEHWVRNAELTWARPLQYRSPFTETTNNWILDFISCNILMQRVGA